MFMTDTGCVLPHFASIGHSGHDDSIIQVHLYSSVYCLCRQYLVYFLENCSHFSFPVVSISLHVIIAGYLTSKADEAVYLLNVMFIDGDLCYLLVITNMHGC